LWPISERDEETHDEQAEVKVVEDDIEDLDPAPDFETGIFEGVT